jgi:hypothetical protein
MDSVEDTISRAIAYIARQHAAGYQNATHVMGAYSTAKFVELVAERFGMPPEQVARFSRFRCEGKVFQVAMITDALQDAAEHGYGECAPLVEENVGYLLSSKEGQSWRYFPGFTPLPYDADSLGQVTQALVRAERARPEALGGAFELAAANTWDDGSLSTFFSESPDPDRRSALSKVWGRGRDDTGRDAEVVANLMFAALLYERHVGPCALGPFLHRAAEWLVERQQPMGFWRASWYVGVYYSTYTVVRFLRALGGHSQSTDRAARFLAQAQASDPLNQALVALTLAASGHASGQATRDLLVGSQFPDGSWEAIPLLDNHARVWGSRTVTTSFCLKALLAAS